MLDEHPIPDAGGLEAAFAAPLYLLLKHSLVCPISTRAHGEVDTFLEAHPTLAAGWIDVRAQRPLSLQVAERTGVRHESPQAILLREGQVVWHGSHYGVTRRHLRRAMELAGKA